MTDTQTDLWLQPCVHGRARLLSLAAHGCAQLKLKAVHGCARLTTISEKSSEKEMVPVEFLFKVTVY